MEDEQQTCGRGCGLIVEELATAVRPSGSAFAVQTRYSYIAQIRLGSASLAFVADGEGDKELLGRRTVVSFQALQTVEGFPGA